MIQAAREWHQEKLHWGSKTREIKLQNCFWKEPSKNSTAKLPRSSCLPSSFLLVQSILRETMLIRGCNETVNSLGTLNKRDKKKWCNPLCQGVALSSTIYEAYHYQLSQSWELRNGSYCKNFVMFKLFYLQIEGRKQQSQLIPIIKTGSYLSRIPLTLDSNMSIILALWPCCFLRPILVRSPLPTLPLNIIPTLALPRPSPFSKPTQYSQSAPASRICSDTVLRGRKALGERLHLEALASAIHQLWGLMQIPPPSQGGPQFPQFAGKKELDSATALQWLWVSSDRYPSNNAVGISFQGRPRDKNEDRPGRDTPECSWAGTTTRETGTTHHERRSPRDHAALSSLNSLSGPNLQIPPCLSHMTARTCLFAPGLGLPWGMLGIVVYLNDRSLTSVDYSRFAGTSLTFKYQQILVYWNQQLHFNPVLSSFEWERSVSYTGVQISHHSPSKIV